MSQSRGAPEGSPRVEAGALGTPGKPLGHAKYMIRMMLGQSR
jgi:hypothetical protein